MKLADKILQSLRPAFSREKTFGWFAVIAIAFMCGPDKGGMAGIVRALTLSFGSYSSIEKFFRSTAFSAQTLLLYWRRAVCEYAPLYRLEDGRAVLISDGAKNAHEGSYMPGVKKRSQQSENRLCLHISMGACGEALASHLQQEGFHTAYRCL
ncbi:MAG: hypothetical protein FWG30_06360 [Eubacteriaceae bacterium]|jgi:hypothetical protein|nr:hypothetical protein [Eubacteriaceae bacterium]